MYSAVNLLFLKRSLKSGSPVADQSVSVTSTSVAVATTGYTAAESGTNPVQFVTFDVQGSNVYVRWDGVDPTSSTGHLLYAGNSYTWPVSNWNAAKFILPSAGTGTLWASAMTS